MKRFFLFVAAAMLMGATYARLLSSAEAQGDARAEGAKTEEAYLMVYFLEHGHNVYFAVSDDGYTFTDVNDGQPVIKGDTVALQRGVRDPHIFRAPDGTFCLALTDLHIYAREEGLRQTQWERDGDTYGWGNNRGLVLMTSRDLVHWSHTNIEFDKVFDGMDSLGCVWAPATVYDHEKKQLMLSYTMRYGNGVNSLFYSYVNDAFDRLLTPPQPLFHVPDSTTSCIDSDISYVDGRYHLYYVNHQGKSGIRHAVADHACGPYTYEDAWCDPEKTPCEAPTLWRRGGEERWVLMYDVFSVRPNNMGFSETTDFVHYTDLHHFNHGVMSGSNFTSPKHGAVISISQEEKQRLCTYWGQQQARLMDEARATVEIPVSEIHEPMKRGRFEPTWESLSQYETPEWFRDAKFGIWAHWGPQCVEGSGDWMARGLYIEDNGQSDYHRQHYGHPSEFGFKDILPLFKAEHWDPEALLRFYKDEVGAQYFFALGNHHDNFDLWDSQYQEWNSMNIGPHKDILEGWSRAARKVGLPFGISFHADHAWTWYEPSRRFDLHGDKIGVKYDGWLTKEDGYIPNLDGSAKWWRGLDPQHLYAQTHDFSSGTWDNGGVHGQWAWLEGAALPTQEYVTNFYDRTLDAINRYHPDMIYFDVTVLPFYAISDAGMKIAAHQYNMTDGKGVVLGKILDNETQKRSLVWDVERGAPNEIMSQPWQCCNCIGGWHYDTAIYENGWYKSAATVAKLLVDIVSKNGNMLLSVPLRADGTPDEKELAILREFGAWMKINSESIVGTRPWQRFGEGPIADSSIQINAQGFNDGNYTRAGSDELRFAQTERYLYVSALAWPDSHTITIRSLAQGSTLFARDINKVELLGYGDVPFVRTTDALVVTLPAEPLNAILPVLKIAK